MIMKKSFMSNHEPSKKKCFYSRNFQIQFETNEGGEISGKIIFYSGQYSISSVFTGLIASGQLGFIIEWKHDDHFESTILTAFTGIVCQNEFNEEQLVLKWHHCCDHHIKAKLFQESTVEILFEGLGQQEEILKKTKTYHSSQGTKIKN